MKREPTDKEIEDFKTEIERTYDEEEGADAQGDDTKTKESQQERKDLITEWNKKYQPEETQEQGKEQEQEEESEEENEK